MSDSELLDAGFKATDEAKALASRAFEDIKQLQELGQPVRPAEFLPAFRATREHLERAVCAFRELESRAAGCPAPKAG